MLVRRYWLRVGYRCFHFRPELPGLQQKQEVVMVLLLGRSTLRLSLLLLVFLRG